MDYMIGREYTHYYKTGALESVTTRGVLESISGRFGTLRKSDGAALPVSLENLFEVASAPPARRALSTGEASTAWDRLKERHGECDELVRMTRDGWEGGYTVQYTDGRVTAARTVSHEVATFCGSEALA